MTFTLLEYTIIGCVIYKYSLCRIISNHGNHSIDLTIHSGKGVAEISSIPQSKPDTPVILDLSFNNITVISKTTFSHLPGIERVTSLYLHHNNLREIESDAFQSLKSLRHLDISSCGLRNDSIQEGAFQSLAALTSLDMQNNSFQKSGYPEHAIGDLSSLQNLTIDVFDGFIFNKTFERLLALEDIKFNPQGTFHLTNTSFEGLSSSPIKQISLPFTNQALCDISEDLFCHFPHLSSLRMNVGGLCDIKPALRSLKCLTKRSMDLINLDSNFKFLQGPPIILDTWAMEFLLNICTKILILSNSAISFISSRLRDTTLWKCLEYIDLSSNTIHQLTVSQVSAFFFSSPKLKTFIACCNNPKGEIMKLGETSLAAFQHVGNKWRINVILSDILEVVDFHGNDLHNLKGLKVSITARSLKELSVANTYTDLSFLSLSHFPLLEKVDVSYTTCEDINLNVLRSFRNVISFKAVHVGFNYVLKRDTLGKFFNNLRKLENLDLSKNKLKTLPKNLFREQKLTLRTLVLEDNLFTQFPLLLQNLQNLRFLFMRKNKLTSINNDDEKILQSLKKIHVYIQDNPISCACSSRTSLRIIKKHQHKFADLNETKCIDSNLNLSSMLQGESWKLYEIQCDSQIWLVISSVLLVVSVGIIAAIVFAKRYKLHLDYLILRLRRRLRGVKYQKLDNDYEYDVFISYAPEDILWVTTVLYKQLEDHNLQACLHEKNFIPGEPVAEQIVKHIDKSRKVLFIITKDFLKSCWASYEVQMAVTHAFHNHRQSMIVLLIKDDTPIIEMPEELKNVWWTLNYLHLPNNDSKNEIEYFWNQLMNILKESDFGHK